MHALAGRSSGYARTVITRESFDVELAETLRDLGSELGDRLVVRSSAVTEDRPSLSGAFASYGEIAPAEIARAVQGCWASVFTEDALGRLEAEGIAPPDVGMAVLVQPELRPAFGGVATASLDGSVEVIGVAGAPAAVVSGWEPGVVAHVASSGLIEGDEAVKVLGAALVGAVADLCVRTFQLVGKNLIEWASDGELWLLQTDSTSRTEPPAATPTLAVDRDPGLESITRTVARYSGPVADAFILSWAIGLEDLPAPVVGTSDVVMAFAEVEDLVERLRRQRWGDDPKIGVGAVAALRAGRTAEALGLMEEASEVSVDDGARLAGLLSGIADQLAADDRIAGPAVFFHLDVDEARALVSMQLERIPGARRIGRGRWEPFLHASIALVGEAVRGRPVVPGPGAGRLRFVRTPGDATIADPRGVIVAPQPVNGLAPLLWEAAAIVTIGGGPGAHLFEVSSSLSVPTVCGVNVERALGRPLETLASHPAYAAVDGTTGMVAIMEGDAR